VCQRAVYTHLDTLLWESSNDLNARDMLAASLGFCGRHSRQLLDFGGQRLAVAVVQRGVLLAALRRLPDLADPQPATSRFRQWQEWLWPRQPKPPAPAMDHNIQPCPACVRQANTEARAVEALLKHLLEELIEPLRQAGGLCLPHFILTAQSANAAQHAVLLQIQQENWAALRMDLEDFIRKHMDHHHDEPISDRARLSVERAIAVLTGEYPVR
jgi:hypothetical protein